MLKSSNEILSCVLYCLLFPSFRECILFSSIQVFSFQSFRLQHLSTRKGFHRVCLWGGSLLIQTQGIFHHQWSWEKIGDQITLKDTTHLWRRKHRSLATSGSNPSMSITIKETNWSYMFCTICWIFYLMFVHLQCFRCGNIGCWLFSRREEQVLLVMWQFPSIGQCCPTTNRRESVHWSSRIRI